MIIYDKIHEYEVYISTSCNQSEFAIRVADINNGVSCIVDVFDVKDNCIPSYLEVEAICTIDVWGKYYFPTFNSERHQWYHSMSENEDRIQAVADAIKHAVKLGLSRSGIKPY